MPKKAEVAQQRQALTQATTAVKRLRSSAELSAAIQATKVWTKYFTRPNEADGEEDGTGGGKPAIATSTHQPSTPLLPSAAPPPHLPAPKASEAAQVAEAVVGTVAQGGTVSEAAKKLSSLQRLNDIFEAAVTGRLAEKTYAKTSTDDPFDEFIDYEYDNAEWTGRAQLSDVANRPGRHFKITLINDHFLYLPPQLVGMVGVTGAAVGQHNIQGGFWYNPKMTHVRQHLPVVSDFVKSFFGGIEVRMTFKLSVNAQRLDLDFRVEQFRLTIQFEPGVGQPIFEEELGVF